MFGASQLWGKIGRAFLIAISERQYMKFKGSDEAHKLGRSLMLSLEVWKGLLDDVHHACSTQ